MTKISDLTALTGAVVDQANDLLPIVDVSEAGAARNKSITVAELLALAFSSEAIDDRVAALLAAAGLVTITYDDGGNILTIDVPSLGSGDISNFNEAVDDRVAALIKPGAGIAVNYDDAAGTFTITNTGAGSGSGSGLAVVATDADDYTVLAADNNKYIRLTAAGTKLITVQDDSVEPLPANGEWHFRIVGGDATFVEDTSVTINPPVGGSLVAENGGTVTLKRVAVDQFDLIGVTVAP